MIDLNPLILLCTVGKTMEPRKSAAFHPSPPTPSNTPRRSPWGTPPATPPATPSDDEHDDDEDDVDEERRQRRRRQGGPNQSNERGQEQPHQQQRVNGAFDSFALLSYLGNWRSTEATPLVSRQLHAWMNTHMNVWMDAYLDS